MSANSTWKNIEQAAPKPRWRESGRGNPCLKYYGLVVTLFSNRNGSHCVSIVMPDASPQYHQFGSDGEARAFAEKHFLTLRGQVVPPKRYDPQPYNLMIIEQAGYVIDELKSGYEEFHCTCEATGRNADLYNIPQNEYLNAGSYLVPRTQSRYLPGGRLVVSKWMLARLEPAS